MNAGQLLAHFDRIAEAPDAIPRLRRFILDLAVRGKLVEQDPNDEPASELLKRIQAVKARLVKEGIIRQQAASPQIESNEIPFRVPIHWVLVRLGDALELVNGRAFKPNEWGKTGLPIVRIQNLNNAEAAFNYCDAAIPEKFHIHTGDFLISWSGTPGTSFGAHIWNRGHAILNQHIFRAEMIGDAFLASFLKLAINSRLLELIDQAHGGVGLQHITKPKLESLPLTLPPLAEQHRIVAKVHELMALCDHLEAAQAEREARRDRLVAASLARLNRPADDHDLHEHADFHLSNLPRLATRPEHVQQLRQTILNLAVRGKLVEQDPRDEPASELLKRIRAEKGRLVNEGKMVKQCLRIDSVMSGMSSKLPAGWAWALLGDVIHLVSGQHLQPGEYADRNEAGPPYVTGPADFGPNGLVIRRYAIVRKAVAKKGQVLLTVKGAGVGKTAICELPEVAISRQLMAMTPIGWNQRFLLLTTYRLGEELRDSARSLIPGISREDVQQFVFALPPLAEQHRIVAKVDELMSLCDRLEVQLTTAREESRRLLEAVLQEVVEGVS